MRRVLIIGSLLTGGLGITLGIAAGNGASAQTASQPPTEVEVEVAPTTAGVEQIALRGATADGDAAPTAVESASTSMARASTLLDQSAPMNVDPRTGEPFAQTPVYVVTMRGHFVANGVPIPRGDVAPTGSTLDMIIDAKSGFVISTYVTNEATLDLSQLLAAPQSSVDTSDGSPPSSNAREASPRATLASNKGVLRGTGYLDGGPHPPRGSHKARVAPNLRVVVTKQGHFVASQHTSPTGTFVFHLRPGKYTLTPYLLGSSPLLRCRSVGASVRAGRTTRVQVGCSVP